jgi:hypothetical protein
LALFEQVQTAFQRREPLTHSAPPKESGDSQGTIQKTRE